MTLALTHGTKIPVPNEGERLALARRMGGFTQAQMAEMLGCSMRTIVRYENGDVSVPPVAALAYSVATDVNLGWLKTGIATLADEGVVHPPGLEPGTH